MQESNFEKDLMLMKQSINDMSLMQLGAEVISFVGLQCFVKFNINGYKISYSYNINSKHQYYLQRIKPYPMSAGTFESASDVVTMIKTDIEQFKSAIESGKFENFLEANTKMCEAARNFEDLFLYYIVDEKLMKEILGDVESIKQKIIAAKESSERFYTEKDPESL